MAEDPLEHAQLLDVDDEFLVRGEQRALQPPGRVQNEIDAAEDRRPHAHHRLVGRLGVRRLGRRQRAASTERKVVVTRHLRAREDAHRRLWRSKRWAARLHVGVGEEGAVDARRAGPDELDQRDPGKRLGGLLRQRARESHRRHRARHQERCDDHRLPHVRVLEEGTRHAVVVAQRAVDVDQADDRRRLLDGLAPSKDDRSHLDRVSGALGRDDAAHEGFVRPAKVGINHVEVPRTER